MKQYTKTLMQQRTPINHGSLITSIIFLFPLLSFTFSCTKFLDVKPNKSLVIPTQVADLQALLDNNDKMNNNKPMLGQAGSDEYYVTTNTWNTLDAKSRAAYVYDTAVFDGSFPNDWSMAYNPIYYANVVLDHLPTIPRDAQNAGDWDNTKGQALVYRARSFLAAAGIWSKAYDVLTAKQDLGIPLRLSSDFNQPSVRATVEDSYGQIIADLKAAIPMLPVTPSHVMRPSRVSALALLARTYLWMRNYDSCLVYADACLQLNASLLNYNTITSPATFPIPAFNTEILLYSKNWFSYVSPSYSYAKVDTMLFAQYDNNDLRKLLFFKANADGSFYFRGSYDGSSNLYNGVTTDEVYLMRAECYARLHQPTAALNDLNTLLSNRYVSGHFVQYTMGNTTDVLQLILKERQKELIFRDLRFADIKRLNKEHANISITRIINGQTIMIPPNDNRYAWPLPNDITGMTGMQQNPR